MGRVFYNKLIRDNIPDKIKSLNETCDVRSITDEQEFHQELLKKVAEEASALSTVSTREEFLSEYADLSIVLDELLKQQEISETELQEAIAKNREKKGGFTKKLFLHWSSDESYKSNETPQGMK